MSDTGNGAGANGGDSGEFKTFMGAGFGTMMVQLSAGPKTTPPVASSRAYLRSGLPAVEPLGVSATASPRGGWP